MSLRDSTFGELKVPLTWMATVAVVIASIVALTLLMNDRRGEISAEAYSATRQVGDKVAAPVGNFFATPLRWAGAGVDGVKSYFFAVSENRRLKAELKERLKLETDPTLDDVFLDVTGRTRERAAGEVREVNS